VADAGTCGHVHRFARPEVVVAMIRSQPLSDGPSVTTVAAVRLGRCVLAATMWNDGACLRFGAQNPHVARR